jgi:hypothetical protein
VARDSVADDSKARPDPHPRPKVGLGRTVSGFGKDQRGLLISAGAFGACLLVATLLGGGWVHAAPARSLSNGPCRTTSKAPARYKHVVWIVMENKSYSDVIGSPTAPYINRLAKACGVATNFYAESSPSLPNYIAMTSGSTQGITDDEGPSAHRLRVPSIFSQLEGDWRALQESMPARCAHSDSGVYAVRHNPAVYYTNISRQCVNRDIPLSYPLNLSARFTFVTPNICNDMHACPTAADRTTQIRKGDTWLSRFLPKIFASRQYRSGSTAVFLTWDEDHGGHIPTLVIAPSTSPGTTSNTKFNHYSLLRTTEQMLGIKTYLGSASSARSMRSAFHF